jgi:RNA-directed DNA polymerase
LSISRGVIYINFIINKRVTAINLIEVITTKEDLNRAYKKVVKNKGASGIDGVTVEELGSYIKLNKDEIVNTIRNKTYFPKPVRRIYIPKSNGKMRPLGIPTALDRTIQQASIKLFKR